MARVILGISAFYHDSAAALLVDGKIVAAAHEERFSRKKHDERFPINAIKYVLEEAGLVAANIDAVAFYDKPFIKFERLLETYYAFAPRGLSSFLASIPVWIKEKLFIKKTLRVELEKLGLSKVQIFYPEHHLSHAASAYYASPFNDAAVLTIDGVGEWATTTICHGKDEKLTVLKQLDFPHSLGLLYSAFTYYTGFKVNSGEYKLMGLAPYGIPGSEKTELYKKLIIENLVDIREDGSLLLNMKYFGYATGLKMTRDDLWTELFGIPPRSEEQPLNQDYMDLALAIQQVTEEIMIKMARTAKKVTGAKYLCMAGGVALNSVGNGKILEEKIFEDIWIQPSAGDAGGALGAAYAVWHIVYNKPRKLESRDSMNGSYLGPEYSDLDIIKTTRKYDAKYEYFSDYSELAQTTAKLLSEGKVVGWHQGRMEWGPRALGARSILGDPRNPEMQKKMNLKIKQREGFRPFAPSVLEEDAKEFFKIDRASPYMLFVIPVQDKYRNALPADYNSYELLKKLYFSRSNLPAITHIDFSARIQSVNREVNPKYWELLNEFKKITGIGILINTSFNVRGEPIVCTPDDSYRCFMRTEMDYLVIGNFLFSKEDQQNLRNENLLHEQFALD